MFDAEGLQPSEHMDEKAKKIMVKSYEEHQVTGFLLVANLSKNVTAASFFLSYGGREGYLRFNSNNNSMIVILSQKCTQAVSLPLPLLVIARRCFSLPEPALPFLIIQHQFGCSLAPATWLVSNLFPLVRLPYRPCMPMIDTSSIFDEVSTPSLWE